MSSSSGEKKQVRIWADGCFDMMHYGHANALRQAKSLGDWLVVGVHSDEEIALHKGPPVMTLEERCEAVLACKWVDEVCPGAPYTTELSYLEKYNCDFCVHGDDLVSNADGVDCYQEVKDAGRFRTVPRTTGVSSTDIVGRMLLMTSSHHKKYDDDRNARSSFDSNSVLDMTEGTVPRRSPYTGVSQFLPTSRKLVQFSEGKAPEPDDVVVYVYGTWDLFHNGHIQYLREAKKEGTYLIVGVLPDHLVFEKKGGMGPIMNLHERVLSVLGCMYVDEVVIGAPWDVTESLIKEQGIHVVVQGTVVDQTYLDEDEDPYKVPKEMGIYKEITSPSDLTTSEILSRIVANRQIYIERNRKKEAKEIAAMENN
eukprot:TRINITY_DN239_c0_g1_i1.p1 TRINITY_DN239_c0_g1~~TRINITY_DN239_c0_g1_i1.p1  ORF type:complete len:368 (+),score=104.06 TRINITY_DN239_c0_g1_i1:724-1827(+)